MADLLLDHACRCLRPVLVFVLVTSVIGSFQIFDTIAVTTQGGPGTSTRTILWYIYQEGFVSMRMGYASSDVDGALSGFGARDARADARVALRRI